jgi:ATP-binding cassette subfamily B protein
MSVRKHHEVRLLLRMYAYLRVHQWDVAIALLSVFIITAISVIQPQLIRWIVDRGIADGDAGFLAMATAGILVMAAFKGLVMFMQGRSTEMASQGVAYQLRKQLHASLTGLSFSFHDKAQSGQLLSRAIQDVERIRFLTGRASLRLLEGAVLLIATLTAIIAMHPLLALLAAPTMPLLAWRAFRFGTMIRPLSLKVQDSLATITALLEQNLRGARIVKAFVQEEAEIRRFSEANEQWFRWSARQAAIQAVQAPLLSFIADLGLLIVVGFGGYLVIRQSLSLGMLVAFTAYMTQLAHPVRMMGVVTPVIGMAAASAERITEIIDAQGEVQDNPDAGSLPAIQGSIRFDHVSFGYANRTDSIKDLCLDIAPGEIVAFLGTTGSGKSTLMNLIPRFYDVRSGAILLDGHDIRSVTLTTLRANIGIVLQESTLFATSIRENIAFGVPEADEESIIAAARSAQAHDFIMKFPAGYDTEVGERGATLSGGQRQRIAIARALLKNPRILLLDDATSSVDAQTEQLIQTALEHLMQGRTCLVIAQRASTLRLATRVIVLDKGRKLVEGRHEDLLVHSPLYAELFRKQVKPAEQRS